MRHARGLYTSLGGLSYTVIWGARMLGATVMMALLFLCTAGWL